MAAFGEKLRKQREQRGIALDAISNTTKISTRMLRALEDEHFDQLPGGVFNKGFVRAYARQVGLDEEEAITDYLTALRESHIQSQKILPDFRASAPKPFEATAPPQPNPPTDGGDQIRNPVHPKNDLKKSGLPRTPGPGSASPDSPPRNQPQFINQSGTDRGTQIPRRDRRQQDRRNHGRSEEGRLNHDRADSSLPDLDRNPGSDRKGKDKGKDKNKDHPTENGNQNQGPDNPDRNHNDQARRPAKPNFAAANLGDAQPDSANSSTGHIPWGKLAVALLLVSATLAFWNLRRQGHITAASAPPLASIQTPPSAATASSVSSPQPSAPPAAPNVRRASPATTAASAPISAANKTPIPAHTSTLAAAVAAPSSTELAANTTTSHAVAPPPAKPSAHTAPVKPPPTFTLLIRAEKTTWISIIADGKTVAEETLIAPANTSVRATHDIVVKTGNAQGISFLLNGKEIAATGNPGEVKTYVFGAGGVQSAP